MKRALCVGVDQVRMGGIPWLQGCCSDARAMKRLLSERFGFQEVAELYNHEATREAWLRSLDWLARATGPGDAAVIYTAAYGSWFPPPHGHDGETLDEVIVVYDHDWHTTMLRDDDIMQGLSRFHPNAAIACVFDTCHAGPTGAGIRCLAPPNEIPHVSWARHRGLLVRPRFQYRRPEDHPGVLYLSACAPNESAFESPIAHGVAGAFTLALTDTLGGLSADVSWDQVHSWLGQGMLSRGLRQTPQLHGPSHLRAQRIFGGLAATPGASVPAASWTPASGPPSQGPGWGAGAGYGAASGGAAPWQAASHNLAPALMGAAYPHPSADVLPSAQAPYSQPVPSIPQPLPVVQPAQPIVVAPDVITPVDSALAAFDESDYTVRLCRAVFGIVPFVPKPQPYPKLRDAVAAGRADAPASVLALAQEHARGEAVGRTLWVAGAIDTGDAGIAVYSGIKSAVGLFMGGKSSALETDPQQAVDASLKLLAISYMIYRLFPGTVAERVKNFYSLPAGQSLAAYYAAIEVALPFADNALASGGQFLHKLMEKHGTDANSKLSSTVGKEAVEGSQGVLGTILAPMEGVVQRVAPMARQIAETASRHLPSALNLADKVAGVVATGADALPAYRYLGARLTAEACADFALRGIRV